MSVCVMCVQKHKCDMSGAQKTIFQNWSFCSGIWELNSDRKTCVASTTEPSLRPSILILDSRVSPWRQQTTVRSSDTQW